MFVCALLRQAAQSAFGANSKWSSWAKKGPTGTAVAGAKKGPTGGKASAAASGDVDPGRVEAMDTDEPAPVAVARLPSAAASAGAHLQEVQQDLDIRPAPCLSVSAPFQIRDLTYIQTVLRIQMTHLCRHPGDPHSTGRHAVEQRPGASNLVEGPGGGVGARPAVCQEQSHVPVSGVS